MKLVLICTSVEPGRDGVGDYSLRLACALIEMGHDVLVIAERDAAVSASAPLQGERDGVSTLRLPGNASNETRASWLSIALDDFAPDWIVLQFVCWGFADRGILDPPLVALTNVLSKRRVAIYCHELWLGLERGASVRHRLWGRQQRISILRFLQMLRPALVLTSNAAYCEVLRRHGWSAQIVPLLSNVPIHDGATSALFNLLEQRSGMPIRSFRQDILLVALFGTVPPEWNPDAALEWIESEAKRRSRRVVIVSAGRPSQKGEAVLTRLARRAGMKLIKLGEVPTEIVSGLLQEADFGMPGTEWLLLGKSGVAAAMQTHGLPMLVVRHRQTFRDLPQLQVSHAPSVFRFDASTPPDFDLVTRARKAASESLSDITRQLVGLLEKTPSASLRP